MKAFPLFHIILLLGFVLILKVPLSASGLIFENNPFYGLNNDAIRSVESITDDSLIRVKLEYAPSAIQMCSPEFFRATLFHNEKNKIVSHADTDIAISKNGKELYKASSEFLALRSHSKWNCPFILQISRFRTIYYYNENTGNKLHAG